MLASLAHRLACIRMHERSYDFLFANTKRGVDGQHDDQLPVNHAGTHPAFEPRMSDVRKYG